MKDLMDIPKDKSYPVSAGQCDGCGGHGCITCGNKGWLPAGHPKTRKCERTRCKNALAPDWVPVYCSTECAIADA